MDILQTLVSEFHLKQQHVENVISLLDDGNTIPFIARYRKEQTGSLDDQLLREIYERLQYLRGLEKRRSEIEAALTEQDKLTEELSGRLPEDAFLVVICGTNTVLREKLAARGLKRTRVVGFTEKMSLYMDAADLYLTKAGGLSTTEALVKRLPLLYVDAVGGCEKRNRDFMLARGWALGVEKNGELPQLAAELLSQPERLERLKAGMENSFTAIAAEKIIDAVESVLSDREGEKATG